MSSSGVNSKRWVIAFIPLARTARSLFTRIVSGALMRFSGSAGCLLSRSGMRTSVACGWFGTALGLSRFTTRSQAGRLLFASEIKALLADPDVPREVDEGSLFQYLSFLTSPAPGTLFANIRKLAGGSMLLVHGDGRVEERRYWDAVRASAPVTGTDEEIAAELLHLLRNSVRLHKVSDVPVGVFLSGGIDSSTIAALHGEGEAGAVRAFTVGYDKDYESYRSEITAGAFRSPVSRCRARRSTAFLFRSHRFSARDGAAARRANCRSGVRTALLCRQARTRAGGDRLPSGRRIGRAFLRISELAARAPAPAAQ